MAEESSAVAQAEDNVLENTDEAIIDQQRAIELEIANAQDYLVKSPEPVSSMRQDYAENEEFLQRIETIEQGYGVLRRTRADGNCFYRAFGFALFEYLRGNVAEYNRILEKCKSIRDSLVDTLGYQQFTVDDFYDNFVEELERIHKAEEDSYLTQLESLFNDAGISNYMVVFLRLVTSAVLQLEQDFYVNFLTDGVASVKDFCSLEVEPIDKETDHVQIMALTSAFGVCIRVFCMERGQHSTVTFPSEGEPVIDLLYRPGHYDILYKKLAS